MAKKDVLVKSSLRKNLADAAAFLRELADKIELDGYDFLASRIS